MLLAQAGSCKSCHRLLVVASRRQDALLRLQYGQECASRAGAFWHRHVGVRMPTASTVGLGNVGRVVAYATTQDCVA